MSQFLNIKLSRQDSRVTRTQVLQNHVQNSYAYRRHPMLLPWRCKTPTNTLSCVKSMKSHLSIYAESFTNSQLRSSRHYHNHH